MWNSIKRIDSSDANVTKFVFEKDDAVAEAVLYKYPTYEERTVICCSVQAGCPIGCRFCGAGDNFVRSLTADEIVSQVTHLLEMTGVDPHKIKRCQVMTMSMGEPLLNFKELSVALRRLYEMYPPTFALLISTSAPRVDYDQVIALSEEIPTVGLQFSVHESTDEARDELIPFKAKLTLAEIAEKGHQWYIATGRQPFFNYCAHDKNSSQTDANNLFRLFSPYVWQATISVICERDESISHANERQRTLATDFMEKLNEYGYSTRCFDPAGQDDIGGGCGQLHFVQDWFKEHADLARPSVGSGKPKGAHADHAADRRGMSVRDLPEIRALNLDLKALLAYIRENFVPFWDGYHGVRHWSRVLYNGFVVGSAEGARLDVIYLFAFLHDHARENDGDDPGHGPRAAQRLEWLRDKFFTLDDAGMKLLDEAITYHSAGFTDKIYGMVQDNAAASWPVDVTVQCCWDADRLDLGRVGRRPNPLYLCTATAKSEEVLTKALVRSLLSPYALHHHDHDPSGEVGVRSEAEQQTIRLLDDFQVW